MKMRLVVCLLLVAACFGADEKLPERSHKNESLLVALENAWNLAQLHHDSKALDSLVADTLPPS
jgi:hypothetical protein